LYILKSFFSFAQILILFGINKVDKPCFFVLHNFKELFSLSDFNRILLSFTRLLFRFRAANL
jgi:hypothetical protein